jgi:hypothetical protein
LPTRNDAYIAGEEGIEPSRLVLETSILPLNYSPKIIISSYYKKGAESIAPFFHLSNNMNLLGFFMQCVASAETAVFFKFQPFFERLFVFV